MAPISASCGCGLERMLSLTLVMMCLSLLLSSSTGQVSQIDPSVCTVANLTSLTPLPALASSWSAEIRWLSMHDRRIFVVREDFDRQRGKSALRISIPLLSTDAKMIYDLHHGYISIFDDVTQRHCTVHRPDYSYYTYNNFLWLASLYEMTRHVEKGLDLKYEGNTNVNGVEVDHYSACLFESSVNSTAFYNLYYAGDLGAFNRTWQVPHLPIIGPAETVPYLITIDIKGQMGSKVIDYQMRGEISRFDQLPIFEDDTFLPPPGTWCDGLPITSLTPLPKSFSMMTEIIDLDFNKVSYEKIWFDEQRKLIRWDWKETVGSTSSSDTDPFSSVYDYNTGIKYKVDRNLLSCSKPAAISRSDPYSVPTGNDRGPFGGQFKMASSDVIFHSGTSLYQKIGKKTIRGVDCDVYIGHYFDQAAARNFTVQWYFTKTPWAVATDNVVEVGALFRMDIWRGGSNKPQIRNILEYQTVRPFYEVFDVSQCFTSMQKIHFVMLILTRDPAAFQQVTHRVLKDRIIQVLGDLINEKNRFSDVEIDYDGNQAMYAYASLMERVPVINRFMNQTTQHTMRDAFQFLGGSVRDHKIFLVKNMANQPVTLIPQEIYRLNFSNDFVTLRPTSPPTTAVPIAPPKRTSPSHLLAPTLSSHPPSSTSTHAPPVSTGSSSCKCPSVNPNGCPSTPSPVQCPGPSIARCRPLCLAKNVCQCPPANGQGTGSGGSSSSSSSSSSSTCIGSDDSSGTVTVAALVGSMVGFLALGLILGLGGSRLYVVIRSANPRRLLSNDDLNNDY